MKYFIVLILFIAVLCILKFINFLVESKQKSISKQIDLLRKNSGYLSINDLSSIDFSHLLELINTYLKEKGYKDIKILKDSTNEKPALICTLNEEIIYVALQPYINSNSNDLKNSNIDIFIANMLKNNCKKGILFTNFTFNTEDISVINNFNDNSLFNIKLIDGYELSRFVRNLNTFTIKERRNV